jgi:HD-GYP domain-containing protein (c-di-GMP phosphodiesterase class II)
MKNAYLSLELLDIVDLLHKDYEKNQNKILDKIAALFNADCAYFIKYTDIESNIKHSHHSLASYTIQKKQTISIYNYSQFKYSQQSWIEKSLKSALSTSVFFNDEIFGVLQIAFFSKYKKFNTTDIQVFEKISKIISFALHGKAQTRRYVQIAKIEDKQIELIYNKKIPHTYKDSQFSIWLEGYLNEVMDIVSANAAGFIYPKEDIYVALSKENRKLNMILYDITDDVKNLATYQIYKKQIQDILLLEDLKKYSLSKSDFAKIHNIQSAIFMPINVNQETIAMLGLGFKEQNSATKHSQVFLQTIAMYLIFAIEASKNMSNAQFLLSKTEEKFIESFVLMMEARDVYTKGHSQRVAYYAQKIAESIGFSQKESSMLYTAGIVHDIGKIGIPDSVLLKPGRLSKEEYKIIQYHPEFSYQIIKDIEQFEEIADCVRYHHERFNGTGYPKGLKEDQIPLGAQILAIADVFDSVTTNRPYRKALSVSQTIELMCSLKHEFNKDLLQKAIPVLKNNFISENSNEFHRDFMPKHIENIRKEIFTKDYMTGLLTRKTFIDSVKKQIKSNQRFTMIYIDIKELSKINYKYSMDVGDKVILYTSEALKKLKNIKYLARTQPDVFYFLYLGKTTPERFIQTLKYHLKDSVISMLVKNEIDIDSWHNIINFYISLSEYMPGKSVEDMMYECQKRKKEMENILKD